MAEPNWLRIARTQIGQKEVSGNKDNPEIMKYYKAAKQSGIKHDETAWCSAFANWVMKSDGYAPTYSLLARSWLKWGKSIKPRLGAIMVFSRGNSPTYGHVGFYVGETTTHYRILGGNQSDSVNIMLIPKTRLLGARWPITVSNSASVKGLGTGVATVSTATMIQPVMDQLSTLSPHLEMLQNYTPYAIFGLLGIGIITLGWSLYKRIKNIQETSYDDADLDEEEEIELDLEPSTGA